MGEPESDLSTSKKIAYREGIGDKLAEGLKFAPNLIRGGERKYAMTHRGLPSHPMSSRDRPVRLAVGLVLNPVGELHGGRGNPTRITFDSLTTCSFLATGYPPRLR